MKYTLKACISDIYRDYKSRRGRNILDRVVSIFFRQDFHLLATYRVGRFFDSAGFVRIGKLFIYLQQRCFSCQLSPRCVIEPGVKFPHPLGIVIGDGCSVERGARIFQHVTLGGKRRGNAITGEIFYPTVRSAATIFPGSTIIGPVTIGESSIVGAMSLVLKDVPSRQSVGGVPAKLLRTNETVDSDED